MGKLGTSTYSETLKNYAFGVAQDVKTTLADFIAPRVPVGVANGQFKKFNTKNAFQIYDTLRAVGGKAKRIEFEASDGTFNCAANALELPIDDQERERAGSADSALEEAKVRTLVISAALAREKKVFDLVKSGVSATASTGSWSSDSSGTYDPIDEIDQQIVSIATATGILPNRMVIGLGAWRILKNHVNVLKRQHGVTDKGLSLAGLAAMLVNPAMDIRVGVMGYDANKMGKSESKQNVVGSEIFIFHGSDNPTQYDPGFAKTFSIGANSVEAVRQYRDEGCRSDIVAVDWSEDVQVVSTLCAKRITVS